MLWSPKPGETFIDNCTRTPPPNDFHNVECMMQIIKHDHDLPAPSKGSPGWKPSPLLRDLQTGHALKVQVGLPLGLPLMTRHGKDSLQLFKPRAALQSAGHGCAMLRSSHWAAKRSSASTACRQTWGISESVGSDEDEDVLSDSLILSWASSICDSSVG